MAEPTENKIGIDETVEKQTWPSFAEDWPMLGKHLNYKCASDLRLIGGSYLTAYEANRRAGVSAAEEDFAIQAVVDQIERSAGNRDRHGIALAYAMAGDLPGYAGFRLVRHMGKAGKAKPRLSYAERYEPASYRLSELRRMLHATLARRRGLSKDSNLDFLVAQLAKLWVRATGKKPTFSSWGRNEEGHDLRSPFGLFVLEVLRSLVGDPKDMPVAGTVRRIVAAYNAKTKSKTKD